MGNHEWCVNCEESDFHHGSPCNPQKVAARLAREQKEAERKANGLSAMQDILNCAGIEYELNRETGYAMVHWTSFED